MQQPIASNGGDDVRQIARSADRGVIQSLYASAEAVVTPEYLANTQVAALLGVPTRTFDERIKSEAWMPRPVMFGPRCVRWSRSEVLAAVSSLVPRQPVSGEPTQLLRGRIERMKRGGSQA